TERKRLLLLSPRHRHQTKTDSAVAIVRGVAAAIGRAQIVSVVAPRTAAQHPVFLFPSTQPCAAISWRSVVTIVIPILAPFPNVAVHVVQTPSVRLKTSDWRCLLSVNTLSRSAIRIVSVKVRLI